MNVSYRVGDKDDDVRRNRELFLGELAIPVDSLATTKQIHSNKVKIATDPGENEDCDGLVTDRPGLFLGVTVADCVPVILVDPVQRVAAAVHAGWRGTAARIAVNGIGEMVRDCGAELGAIRVFLGPSAAACCYEVGEEVAEQFPSEVVSKRDGMIYLDVRKANYLQLLEAGVQPELIEENTLCTISEADLLHSFRRDGSQSGRMLAVVGFRA
jgi:YfiH family protein